MSAITSKLKSLFRRLKHSLQLRYAAVYLLTTALVSVFLNTYPIRFSQELVFQTKQASMMGKAEMVASALAGLDRLAADGAEQVARLLNDVSVKRIIVTDEAGMSLYDTANNGNTEGSYVVYPAVVSALEGNNAFYARSSATEIECQVALPVTYRRVIIGSVYLAETDNEQAALLVGIQRNMRTITIGVLLFSVAIGIISVLVFSRRMNGILNAVRVVREGEYSHKIALNSRDELGLLAQEFNALTDRIQTTESMRRQFVSDASHELKTPLAAITLMTDTVLQNEMDKETILEFVGDIGMEANRLSRMTEKLLQLSRLENASRNADVPLERVDLAQIAERVLKILWPLAQEREVRLVDHMDKDCTVLARSDDIYEIIFNVAENGIKYNRVGGTLELLLYRRENATIMIFDDEGIGIPPEETSRIFERFYRVDKARSREAGGSGIGLAIVHDMVLRYGGTIEATARENGGTRFTITFPWYGEVQE